MNCNVQMVITEKCNLSCKYCYMQNRNSVMTSEIFKESISFVEKSIFPHLLSHDSGFENSSFALFGGEPLTNMNLIYENVDFIKSRKHKHLVTNGILLTSEIIELFKKIDLPFNISFDGEIGNTLNRVNCKNESSISNYNDFHFSIMKTHGCKVMLTSNLFDRLIETYEYFVSRGILFPDFSLVRDNIYTDNDISKFKYNLNKLTDEIIKNFNAGILAIPGIYKLYLLDTVISSKYGKREFGCFAGISGIGVMPGGKIYPCARFGSADKFCIGDTNTGLVDYDILKFIKNNYNLKNIKKCQMCKLFHVCNAGCYFSQLQNGNWEKLEPVDSVCELLKISFNESYRLYNTLKNEKIFIEYLNNQLRNGR